MGNINAVRVVSKVFSADQAACGNLEGSCETQHELSNQCLVVSPLRSAVKAKYDVNAAIKTQLEFLENLEKTADSGPVLGDMKKREAFIVE